MSRETLESYPTLDVVIRGEPEMSIVEVIRAIDRRVEAEHANETISVGNTELTAPWRKLPFPDASYLTTRGRFAVHQPGADRRGAARGHRHRVPRQQRAGADQPRPAIYRRPGQPAHPAAR